MIRKTLIAAVAHKVCLILVEGKVNFLLLIFFITLRAAAGFLDYASLIS